MYGNVINVFESFEYFTILHVDKHSIFKSVIDICVISYSYYYRVDILTTIQKFGKMASDIFF